MANSVWDRVLLLETSGTVGQVALSSGDQVIVEMSLDRQRRRASDLAKMCQDVLQQAQWNARDLTAVVVSMGPGSYTALRVGIASAKMLAYACGCPFIGVETFAAYAWETQQQRVTVVSDALQGDVFHRKYICDHGQLQPETPLEIISLETARQSLSATDVVTGPSATALTGNAIIHHAEQCSIKALLQVAQHADWAITRDMWTAEPYYLRGSSAEEKRKREPSAT